MSVTSTGSESGNIVALSNDNVALRGMSLRNTEYVTGIVVYTGHDTKIQKNSAGAKYKASNVTHTMNWQILFVFSLQIILAAAGALYGSLWTVDNIDKATYLDIDDDDEWNSDFWYILISKTGTWILIFT